jgi:hypothetical protein
MKSIAVFLSFVLSWMLAALPPPSAKASMTSFAERARSKAQLQLTTTVMQQRACSTYELGFKLKLMFRNVGNEPIILDRRVATAGVMVSRDLKAAEARKYEQVERYDLMDEPDIDFAAPNLSTFVILQPGEVFEAATSVSVSLDDGTPTFKNSLRTGIHFIQVGAVTWRATLAKPGSFRRKWRDKGYLWSEPVTSIPMQFTVDSDRRVAKCF